MRNEDMHDDQIDIISFLRTFWRRRRLIVYGISIVTLGSILIAVSLPRTYRSHGFYQANISAPLYKTCRNALTDTQRFFAFLESGQYLNATESKDLRRSIRESRDLANLFVFVFESGSGDSGQNKENSSNVLGLEITSESHSPERAQKTVFALGAYIKDSLLNYALHEYINSNFKESSESLRTIDKAIIENAFAEKQLLVKKSDLQKLKAEYPSVAIEIKQVFTVKGDGYQYLSTTAEVIKTQAAISETRRERAKLVREREMAEMRYNFFAKARDLLKNYRPGEVLFREVLSLKDQFFSKDSDKDTVKDILSTLPVEKDSEFDLSKMRFVSGPTLPSESIAPNKRHIVLWSFIISLFTFPLLALLVDWWGSNKSLITEPVDLSLSSNPLRASTYAADVAERAGAGFKKS
ncbi:MAG: hypothetical protein HY549_02060 [Elusimicrobia bacterium]|nr:hypothetical protein [Elusimicrobiota bacterium]